MTTQRLNPRLKKFKAVLLSGNSVASASKELGIGKSTGYEYAKKLEYIGEIRRVGGSTNPVIYEDAKRGGSFGGAGSGENPGIHYGVVTPSGNPEDLARPSKLVRVHISGAYVVDIETVGNRGGRIADSRGYTIGGWKDEQLTKGTRTQIGFLYGFNEVTKFRLYLASAGPKLNIYPRPRMVYYKDATAEGPRQLEAQCIDICKLLEREGWAFIGRPALSGVIHYGGIDPKLLGLADRSTDWDNSPVHADTSNGDPEVEIYATNPNAQRDIDILSTLPDRIAHITDTLSQIEGALCLTATLMSDLSEATTKMQKVQADTTAIISKMLAPPMPARPFEGVGYL